MIRVVFDTNVLISALIKTGLPEKLFRKVLEGELELVISEEILNELIRVCQREKIKKYVTADEINRFVYLLLETCKIIDTKSNFKVIKEDPDDNKFLNVAYDSNANYIVSGDEHLLRLKEFKGIKILTVREMLNILEK